MPQHLAYCKHISSGEAGHFGYKTYAGGFFHLLISRWG